MEISYSEFFRLFHEERDYFECHEVMEELWVKETEYSTKKHPAVTLLLVGVGAYHWRGDNYSGALKVFQNALESLTHTGEEIRMIGVDPTELHVLLEKLLEKVSKREKYEDFDLPMIGS